MSGKKLSVDDIRKKYLEFFQQKDHVYVASDSLVPRNDPTLLFTGAGMNQFKEHFLGIKKDITRATSSQKCLRTGDLEEVGRTAYHHSFFEMLGNFSFGDYFKKEAIHWAWEFLTKELHIPIEKLRVSVHKDDEEAYKIWRDEIGVRPEWIYKLGDKSNFWPANAPADGPNGPCGPCSEIYYDQAEFVSPEEADSEDIESSRFAEIWNLVFTQYDRQEGGKLIPLKQKNIDTGMGLERLACVLQAKASNYQIDSLARITEEIEKRLGQIRGEARQEHLYAIADHVRAVVFCIADGVIPSNEGRGYVIRKLIRRALWHAYQVSDRKKGLGGPFLFELVKTITDIYKKPYPEVAEAAKSVEHSLKGEEERFLETLERGMNILENRLNELKASGVSALSGESVFELYDTYGFPEELTRAIAQERSFSIDHEGFVREMEAQRKRAKDATQISSAIFSSTELEGKLNKMPATRFLGYQSLESEAKVLLVDQQGKQAVVVLDQTPCYGESGGQVGDQGLMTNGSFKGRIADTQKKDNCIFHLLEIESGALKEGDAVSVKVDADRRYKAMRNHTATHLLHSALRVVLGAQTRQLGSLVSPDKLRFDYSHSKPLTPEEVMRIEAMVNEQILANVDVSKEEKPIEQAKKEGAIAFFGEKYGKKVRVVGVSDFSKEFCGGTHCDSTGQIGSFVITSDTSIASGTRRIEAVTGDGAMAYLQSLRSEMQGLAQSLKAAPGELGERVAKLQSMVKKLEKQRKQGGAQLADTKALISKAKTLGGYKFIEHRLEKGAEVNDMRLISDALKTQSANSVYLLSALSGEKVHYLIGMSQGLAKAKVDLRDLHKKVSAVLGGSGGGRKDLVQGGARNDAELTAKWKQVISEAEKYLMEIEA